VLTLGIGELWALRNLTYFGPRYSVGFGTEGLDSFLSLWVGKDFVRILSGFGPRGLDRFLSFEIAQVSAPLGLGRV